MNKLSPGKKTIFIDTTANIGGVTLQLAMFKKVERVISYDLDPSAIEMLRNNVKLFKLEDKIEIRPHRFDFDIPSNSEVYVSIDPPYEISNNPNNFNLSIENRPIYEVVEDLLQRGVRAVFLEMPAEYKYSYTYAKEHNHNVNIYVIPSKKIKIIAISYSTKLTFKRFRLVKDIDSLSPYSAKLEDISENMEKISYYKKNMK